MKDLRSVAAGLWAYLSGHYRTSIVRKGDSEMALVAMFLDNMGIVDRERFLSRYTTTIGQTIYVPFVIGDGDDAALWGQVVTAVHEHQHVEQAQRLGFATFATAYLFDSSRRAAFEAEAYRTTLELHRWRYHETLTDDDCDRIAGKLADYACTPEQIEFAAKYLKTSNKAIAAGAIVNDATKRAVDWLGTCAPWLRK